MTALYESIPAHFVDVKDLCNGAAKRLSDCSKRYSAELSAEDDLLAGVSSLEAILREVALHVQTEESGGAARVPYVDQVVRGLLSGVHASASLTWGALHCIARAAQSGSWLTVTPTLSLRSSAHRCYLETQELGLWVCESLAAGLRMLRTHEDAVERLEGDVADDLEAAETILAELAAECVAIDVVKPAKE